MESGPTEDFRFVSAPNSSSTSVKSRPPSTRAISTSSRVP
jgi:hypothetical protein